MPPLFSLKMLLDLARNRSDDAARNLERLNSEEQEAENLLRLLLDYRQDYQIRLQENARNGIDHIEWSNFLAFMAKLDAAIAEQHKAVTIFRNKTQAGRCEWHDQQRKLKSYDTLLQRHAHAESVRVTKREQREQDEQALKSFVHGNISATHT